MPEMYREEKMREFINLRQKSMTVAENEVKFTQLSPYAPMMVATERDKCRRFEDGLHYDIRSRLTLSDTRTYQELRAAATRVERLLKENERYQAARNSKRTAEQSGGESSDRSGKKSRYSTLTRSQGKGDDTGHRGGQSQATGQSSVRGLGIATRNIPLCERCGRPHRGKCRAETGACYLCGEQGHFLRDCPKRREVSAVASDPRSKNC